MLKIRYFLCVLEFVVERGAVLLWAPGILSGFLDVQKLLAGLCISPLCGVRKTCHVLSATIPGTLIRSFSVIGS